MQDQGRIPEGISGFGASSAKPQASSAAITAGAPPPGEELEEPTPEEQRLYENFVAGAASLIFDPSAQEAMKSALMLDQEGETPAEGLALAASTAAVRSAQGLSKSIGGPIPGVIITSGMEEIVGQVAELGEKMGAVQQYSEEDMQGGYIGALDQTRLALAQAGVISKEDAAETLEEIKGMGDGFFSNMGVVEPTQAAAPPDTMGQEGMA